MVEGLINNFKSNNWRAGQIHKHTHTHTLLGAYAKRPAQAQMHIIHTCLLIYNAQKSNRKAFFVISVHLCTVPFSLLLTLLPQLPTLSEGNSWSEEEVLWVPRLQDPPCWQKKKNTPSPLQLSSHIWLYKQLQPFFHYNDIILIGEATAGLHLLALGMVIRHHWIMLIWVPRGKDPLTRAWGQTASAVSGSFFRPNTDNPQIVSVCWPSWALSPFSDVTVQEYSCVKPKWPENILMNIWPLFTKPYGMAVFLHSRIYSTFLRTANHYLSLAKLAKLPWFGPNKKINGENRISKRTLCPDFSEAKYSTHKNVLCPRKRRKEKRLFASKIDCWVHTNKPKT